MCEFGKRLSTGKGEQCNYAVFHCDSGKKLSCLRPSRHPGPCLSQTNQEQVYLWCGRVCEGCPRQGDPDAAIIIRKFSGDAQAVLAGKVTVSCLFQSEHQAG